MTCKNHSNVGWAYRILRPLGRREMIEPDGLCAVIVAKTDDSNSTDRDDCLLYTERHMDQVEDQ